MTYGSEGNQHALLELIPENSDLNDYRHNGEYNCLSGEITSTLMNCPFTDSGFRLLVYQIGGSTSYITQVIIKYDKIFVRRTNTGNVFSPWNKAILQNMNYGFEVLTSYYNDKGYFIPNINASVGLGSSNYKWSDIYSTNGTIQTSDKNEKTDISYIGEESAYDTAFTDEKLCQMIENLKPCVFKRKDGESGRHHHGIISQDFGILLQSIGIDHAGFIKSPKFKALEDGTAQVIEDEYDYSLRYEELIADLIRYVQLLNDRITELENFMN